MKFLILCALLAVASSLKLDDHTLHQLANLKFEELPKKLQDLITLDNFKAGDNSHWCCTNDQPVNTIQRTKLIKETHVVATKVKTGYTSCGFNGWMMCSLYTTQYKVVVTYHEQTYEVPDESACADHHVKCCKDHIEIAGNCLAFTTLSQHLDLLQALTGMGLLTPATPGK